MNIFRKYLPFYILILVYGCSGDPVVVNNEGDDPEEEESIIEEVYFTYKAYENTSSTDNWVIVHTDTGVLLDYKPFEEGDLLVFEEEISLLSDKIGVSVLKYFYDNNGNYYVDVLSTLDVTKGSVWDNEPITNPTQNSTGSLNVTLANFEEIHDYIITNEKNIVHSGGFSGFQSGGVYTYTSNPLPLYEFNDYLVSFSKRNTDFKYHFLNDVQNGDDISVDYNQFQLFDDYIDVNLPLNCNYAFSVNGLEDYQDVNNPTEHGFGYILNRGSFSTSLSSNNYHYPLRVGYLDRFNKFRTYLNANMDDYSYEFEKLGDKPTLIVVPQKPIITVNDNSLQDFDFAANIDFNEYTGYWVSTSGTYDVDYIRLGWEVNSPTNSNHIIGDLPNELLLLYPNIDISLLELYQTKFVLNSEEKITVEVD